MLVVPLVPPLVDTLVGGTGETILVAWILVDSSGGASGGASQKYGFITI